MESVSALFGQAYASMYWCLFPPPASEQVVPRLQDCQDNLLDRLSKLQQRQRDLELEIRAQRSNRDRSKLRRMFIELKALSKDVSITENTLFLVDRQLQLFERNELDMLVVNTLHSSCAALNNMGIQENNTAQSIDELTDVLQNKMSEITEMNNAMSNALQQGVESDFGSLEKELEDFLAEDVSIAPLSGSLQTTTYNTTTPTGSLSEPLQKQHSGTGTQVPRFPSVPTQESTVSLVKTKKTVNATKTKKSIALNASGYAQDVQDSDGD